MQPVAEEDERPPVPLLQERDMGVAIDCRIESFGELAIRYYPEQARIVLVTIGRGSEVLPGGNRGQFRDRAGKIRVNEPETGRWIPGYGALS